MLGYTMSAANCLMGEISSCEAKMNMERKLLNACSKLDSVVGVSNVKYCPCVCMYVCMVITYSRVWINRVRLPILLVGS